MASSTALMFWCLSSTEDLLRPFSSWRSAGCARTCGTAPQPPRHAACRNSLRPWRDLFFGPVFADANDAKPEPRQRRNDGRLATGEAVSSERALLGKLLAEGHTGDGLGIAIGAGLRITYRGSRGTCRSRGAPEFRAAQLHELIDGSLHGGGASKLGELRHRVLPYCHGVPGTAEPRDYE